MSENVQSTKPSQLWGWITMVIFWLGIALGQVLIFGLGIVLPGMMEDLKFGPVEAGTLGAVGYYACFLLLTVLTGFLTKFRSKLILGLMFAVLTLVFVFSGLAPSYIFLLIVRAIGLVVTTAFMAVVAPLQRQWFETRQMGTVNGLQSASSTLGQIIGLSIVPLLLANFGGWRGTYYLVAIATGVITLIWFIFAKENRTPEFEASLAVQKQGGSSIKEALKRKEFLIMGLGLGGALIAYIAFFTFWPTLATQVKGLNLTTVGQIMAVTAFGSLVGALLSGVISDKLGVRKPPIIIATLLLPVAYFILVRSNSPFVLSAAFFMIGFLAFAYAPLLFTICFELKGIKPQEIGVGISIILALTQLGSGLGSQLAGITINALGPSAGLTVLLFSPLLMTLAILFVPETGPKAKKN